MSEVKRFDIEGSEWELIEGRDWVTSENFDRVTAERDAALGREAALREELADAQRVLSFSGNESDAYSNAALHDELDRTQQRLTAADDLLTCAVALLEYVTDTGELTSEEHSELEAEICKVVKRFWSRNKAALKPSDGGDDV